jgi:hypothetical protein
VNRAALVFASMLFAAAPGLAVAEEPSGRPPSKVSLGAGIGIPHFLGPVIEIGSNSVIRFQASGSLLLIINSATARIVVGEPVVGTRPYAFAGGGILDIEEGDGGSYVGATKFFWFGGGLRIRLWRRVGLFAEIGSMQHEKKGFDRTGAAGSAGFLVGL